MTCRCHKCSPGHLPGFRGLDLNRSGSPGRAFPLLSRVVQGLIRKTAGGRERRQGSCWKLPDSRTLTITLFALWLCTGNPLLVTYTCITGAWHLGGHLDRRAAQ